MTPQPQQEYIITHLQICSVRNAEDWLRISEEVRSRPHQPAAPSEENNELEELGNQDIDPAVFEAYANACNKGAEEQYLKEYAATIRNQTLDELQAWVINQCWHNNPQYPSKHKAPRKKEMLDKIESLRTTNPQEQPRARE